MTVWSPLSAVVAKVCVVLSRSNCMTADPLSRTCACQSVLTEVLLLLPPEHPVRESARVRVNTARVSVRDMFTLAVVCDSAGMARLGCHVLPAEPFTTY